MRALAATLILLASLVPLAPTVSAATFTVSASNFAWTPSALTIAPGDSVTFTNGGGSHNWVRDDAPDSCSLPCTRTFTQETLVEYHCGIHPSMTGSILVATPVTVTISSPSSGATVQGLLTVTGLASHGADDIDAVTVTLAGQTVGATLSGGGTSVTWTAQVQTDLLANGAATLTASAQTSNGATGSASIPITLANPPRIDLRVPTASAQSNAIRGNIVSFSITNDGNVPAPASIARGEYFSDGAWHAFGDADIPILLPGQTVSRTLTWSPTLALGAFDIRIVADPDHALADADRSDNVRITRGAFVTLLLDGVVVP